MDRAGLVSARFRHHAAGASCRAGSARSDTRLGARTRSRPDRSSSGAGAARRSPASLKFLGIFVAVGGYALIWGWRFARRVRPPHPRARARALRRGAAAGAESAAARLHPVPRRVRRAARPAVRPVAERARLASRALSPAASPRSPASSTANAVDSDLLRALAYAGFLLNLVQPDPDRVPRRRPHPPLLARPPRGRRPRRPGRGAAAGRCRRAPTRSLLAAALVARDGRRARPAGPPVSSEPSSTAGCCGAATRRSRATSR